MSYRSLIPMTEIRVDIDEHDWIGQHLILDLLTS